MAFGLSFGKKKQSSTVTEESNKLENITQNQNQSGSTSTTGSTTGSQTQQTNQSQVGTSNQTSTQQNASNQTQTGASFSGDVLGNLESAVNAMLGNAGQSSQSVVDSAIKTLSGFDSAGFVNDTVRGAEGRVQTSLDQTLGGIADSIGSGLGNNSMAALLAQRSNNDATAELAGVRAQAQAQAQEITRQNAATAISGAQGQDNFLANLLNSLKGGVTTQTATGTETATGTQAGTTGQTTTGTSATQTAEQQTTQVIQELMSLLQGTTDTSLSGTSTTKGKSSGGGLSLAI